MYGSGFLNERILAATIPISCLSCDDNFTIGFAPFSETVSTALKDVVSLTGKLTDSDTTLPKDLPDLPRELSFWIAAHLGGRVADEQQRLLEMTNTVSRLDREYEMLDQTRRQLAARTALKETFSNVDKTNN